MRDLRHGVAIGFCHAIAPDDSRARIETSSSIQTIAATGSAGSSSRPRSRPSRTRVTGAVAFGVRADNHPAVGLYRSLGFTTADEMITRRLPRA